MSQAAPLTRWLLEPETGRRKPGALLSALVERLEAAVLSLFRVSVWIPTKHPDLWGNQIIWDREEGCRILRRDHDTATSTDYIGTPSEE